MARVLHVGGGHLRRKSNWWRRLLLPSAGRYRAGLEGELRVAAVLGRLSRRYWVLHDVNLPGRKANLDHVVVGPRGVVVVETKYYAAEVRGRAGKPWRRRKRRKGWRRFLPGGWMYIHDPTAQARRGAHRLEARLRRREEIADVVEAGRLAVAALVVFAHPRGRVRARSRDVPVVGLRRLRRAVRRTARGRLPRAHRRRVAEAVFAILQGQ